MRTRRTRRFSAWKSSRTNRCRNLRLEPLEQRRLLAAGIVVTPPNHLFTMEDNPTTPEEDDPTTVQFEVALNSRPADGHIVTVVVESGDTSEGVVSSEHRQLTFDSSNWQRAQPVIVWGVNDGEQDGQQPYVVLMTSESTDLEYDGRRAHVSLSNVDDKIGIAVVPASELVTGEDGRKSKFQVFLNEQPSGDVTIEITSLNTGAGKVSADDVTFDATATLTFTVSNWKDPRDVYVQGQNERR